MESATLSQPPVDLPAPRAAHPRTARWSWQGALDHFGQVTAQLCVIMGMLFAGYLYYLYPGPLALRVVLGASTVALGAPALSECLRPRRALPEIVILRWLALTSWICIVYQQQLAELLRSLLP